MTHLFKMIFLIILSCYVLRIETKGKIKGAPKATPRFPQINEFFKKKANIKKKYKLGKCEVEVRKEPSCFYKMLPKKGHCLAFTSAILELIPDYMLVINSTELIAFKSLPVSEFLIDACSQRISFRTTAEGEFILIASFLRLTSVEADISIPIPLGDYFVFGDGIWSLGDYQFKVKFYKERPGMYSIKGASEIDFTPIEEISSSFGLDILPKTAEGKLLEHMQLQSMLLRNCKVYGSILPHLDEYQLVFSGAPSKRDLSAGNIRIFVTKSYGVPNIALLLEMQDYSPVTLLRKIYGPVIKKLNVVRDRNQTIALYISSQPTANFSSVITSHGSSRWLHMNSQFDAGATLLVTIPFPKRKAVDMKIKLLAGGLEFSLPENENLMGDLALGAISPSIVERIDQNERNGFDARNDDKRYSKMRILKFRYFIANDTYLAAAESLKTMEEELAEVMPTALVLEKSMLMKYLGTKSEPDGKLEDFFKREEKDDTKRNIDLPSVSPVTSSVSSVTSPVLSVTSSAPLASVGSNTNSNSDINIVNTIDRTATVGSSKNSITSPVTPIKSSDNVASPIKDIEFLHSMSVDSANAAPSEDTSLFGSSLENTVDSAPKELNLLGLPQIGSKAVPDLKKSDLLGSSSTPGSSNTIESDIQFTAPLVGGVAVPTVEDTSTSSITTYIPMSETATEKSDLLSLAEKIGLLRKRK